MAEIPLYNLLFIYLLFLTIFSIFALINFYHIVMTASLTATSFFASFFMFIVSVLVIYITWWLLQDVNWQQILITIPDLTTYFNNGL